MDLNRSIGLTVGAEAETERLERALIPYINLKLAFLGCPPAQTEADPLFREMAALLSHHRETERLLADYLCPADQRIQEFLEAYLGCGDCCPRLPGRTFVLDRHGQARALSLPANGDAFASDIVRSYRVRQGVLHNPKSDRRTTEGIFHVAEGGLPIPDDKRAVPKEVFGEMLRRALAPPPDLLRLPFTSEQAEEARCWVSLLLRPVVCPEVPGVITQKSMEVRFFAPGTLASNLDFLESIFGNAGDPFLPENDAGLDVEHWSGHTGCVILAPHLVTVTKREAGLPRWEEATERQRRDGMCWRNEDDLYNNGVAFKLTCRDQRGVIVTIIADSYFGYCKKEVKTQISFAANLSGTSEEEHAGGALVFPSYDLGEEFSGDLHVPNLGYTFGEMIERFGTEMDVRPDGYAVDRRWPDILYVPEDARFDLRAQTVRWPGPDGERGVKLLPGKTYVRPSGYKIHMEKVPGTHVWRLVGTVAEGTLCHKPCTVSGGGKSEISKPITDAILQGSVFAADFVRDFDQVAELIARDYSDRFRDPARRAADSRPILSPKRSLGSVIQLLLPASRDFTEEYNEWVRTIPQYIKELVFVVKRFYRPEWGENWREHFSVDTINGTPGNELRCDNRKIVAYFLRVGYEANGSWRTFGLRQDFHPAAKIAFEDDITASVVVPTEALRGLNPDYENPAAKFVHNCEYRLFQRPDDAVHRGYDKQTEGDFSRPGNFFSNYEPLTITEAHAAVEDAIRFDQFTEPMQRLIGGFARDGGGPTYFVSNADPRIVEGKPTKNPRYLQTRPDLLDPRGVYLAEMGTRLRRRIAPGEPVHTPVNAVLPGRRNNPPDPAAGIRPLAVFNPIHYLPLPELFMEFISSITGKSPSTTGAGSEGALTKGPFNALPPILDLNNALVSYLLTGHEGFVTAAGYVGPHARMDHDVSLLVPEVWCRMAVFERDPAFLMRNGYLEKCEDLDVEGRRILTSRLGWRITRRFVRTYFGRMFNHPQAVFTEEMLRPEKQDLAVIVDAMDNIVEAHERVARHYFDDGSVEWACPPLRALLHIMRDNVWEGKELSHPDVRALFTRENLLASDWWAERQAAQREAGTRLWERHVGYLENFLAKTSHADEAERLHIRERLERARCQLEAAGG